MMLLASPFNDFNHAFFNAVSCALALFGGFSFKGAGVNNAYFDDTQ
jgi:hypothetical protein